MRSFWCYSFDWFTITCWFDRFLNKVIIICCLTWEFIALWEIHFLFRVFRVGICSLWNEVAVVGCWTIKWLGTRIKIFVFYSYWISASFFRDKSCFIPRLSFEWNLFILIFNSWHKFLSQLRLMSRIILSISRIYISIWSWLILWFLIEIVITFRKVFTSKS